MPTFTTHHHHQSLPTHPRGKQKTGVCRKTTSPRWDQILSWDDLSIEDLADRSLEIGVWDHDRLGHQDFLGGVRLNLGSGKLRPRIYIEELIFTS